MRLVIFIFIVVVSGVELSGQNISEIMPGRVSFVTSRNIYVKFKSTSGLSAGDTLFISSNGKLIPVLKINNLSSVSCVGTPINGANLPVDQEILGKKKNRLTIPEEKHIENTVKNYPVLVAAVDTVKKHFDSKGPEQKISGSISAYSYSDFSNTQASNSNRFRYTLSLDAWNIADSKLSISGYISFRHKLGDWAGVKRDLFTALKVYNLYVKYDLNNSTKLSLGRAINQKISSIGSMDGLQFEKSINRFALGAVAGFRPDYTNFGFDGRLFQYGAYVAYLSKPDQTFNETSLAFLQQMNKSNIDRRFLYFQHSNTLIKSIYFFSSFEIDLYKLKNYQPQNSFDLTSLYISLRYRMTKNLTLTGSFDERKNVMYYETYKTTVDSLLEKEMRQTFRLQGSYRITRNILFGLESGYRSLNSDPHPSKSFYGYVTWSQIPVINVSATLSGTYLESNYLNGKILGMTILRNFFKGKFQTSLGYRYVDYNLPENLSKVNQNIVEINTFWQFANKMSFSANYEGTFETQNKFNRIYLQLRKRF